MKRTIKYLAVFLIGILAAVFNLTPAYAKVGDMGFFGGISEGRRLPRTTETLLVAANTRASSRGRRVTDTFRYTELVFLEGRPVQFDGLIDISADGAVEEGTATGAFTVEFRVYPSFNTNADISINRTIEFDVTYRVEGSQVIYTYEVAEDAWQETITLPEGTFTLNRQLSSFIISIIEDQTPGVDYYRGDVSAHMVYASEDAGGGEEGEAAGLITMDQTSSFYGYSSAWSSTETHRVNVVVHNDGWAGNGAMEYEIRPSVTVNKILQYTQNEPTAISFEGNFKEVLQNFAGLRYDIYVKPNFMWDEPDTGVANINSVNIFEQLPEPNLSFLEGDASEDDIRRLFAMQILTGDTRYYVPSQAITRGQYMTALAKAIKLPIQAPDAGTGRGGARNREPDISYLFNDVDSTLPEYPYIMAIFKAGIAVGRDTGDFEFNNPIQRQEAFVVLVRALGLTQLGMNPTTATFFVDDAELASWAKREVAVANMLGLITPDENGRIRPQDYITKGEAAALFNTFIEYMRNRLASDYGEQIVNIPR